MRTDSEGISRGEARVIPMGTPVPSSPPQKKEKNKESRNKISGISNRDVLTPFQPSHTTNFLKTQNQARVGDGPYLA